MKTISEQIWHDFVSPSGQKFLVKTRSIFENVYEVEADSYTEAAALVESADPPDFYQKHLKEDVYSIEVVDYNMNVNQVLTSQGYF
jgi:hypothetical protein